jgi:hypothetical protein
LETVDIVRQHLGLIAGGILVVMGTAFLLSPATRVYGVMVVISGGVGVWYGLVALRQARQDRYDLSKLFDGEAMPEGGEGIEDNSGYCAVCGAYIKSPYEPCPKCGAAL